MGGSGSGFWSSGTSVCAATGAGFTGSEEMSGGTGGPIVDGTVGAMAWATGRAAFLVSLLSHATSPAKPTPRINRLKRLKQYSFSNGRRPSYLYLGRDFASNGSRATPG